MTADAQTEGTPALHYYWPNKLGRTYLLALEEVLGKNGVNAVLNLAGLRRRIGNYPPDNLDLGWSFEEIGALNQALDDAHGCQDGQRVAVHAGRVWFSYAVKDFGAVLGIVDLAFRLLPLSMKVKLGLSAIAETFNKTSDQIARVEAAEDGYLYHIDRCPTCWGRTAEVPICHADLGLLQGGLHWVTSGQTLPVEEIQCIAKGDPSCTYIIGRQPQG